MANEKVLNALETMGLEWDEARTYKLLVSIGSATVGRISNLTGYSRTKTYAIFDKLLSKGWIKRISDKPKTFVPISPHQITSHIKKSMSSALEIITKDLTPIYNSAILNISETMTYRGYDVFKKVDNMLANTKKDVKIITAFFPTEVFEKVTSKLIAMKAKGIKIKCIVSKQLENNPVLKNLRKKIDVKIRSVPCAGLIIIDDNEVLFGSVEEKGRILSNLLGIWTKNKELIKFSKIIFDHLLREENSK